MPSSPSMKVTLLLQDAVFTNPGSYTASAAPSPSLILPRSAPFTAPFSMGTSYSWPVRLSRTVRESFTLPNLLRAPAEGESGSDQGEGQPQANTQNSLNGVVMCQIVSRPAGREARSP